MPAPGRRVLCACLHRVALVRYGFRNVRPAQLVLVAVAMIAATAAFLGPYLAARDVAGIRREVAGTLTQWSYYLPGGSLYPGIPVVPARTHRRVQRPMERRVGDEAGSALGAHAGHRDPRSSDRPKRRTCTPLFAHAVPGLDTIRVVFRLGAVVVMSLCVFAGLGAVVVIRYLERWGRVAAIGLIALAAVVVLWPIAPLQLGYSWTYFRARPTDETMHFTRSSAGWGTPVRSSSCRTRFRHSDRERASKHHGSRVSSSSDLRSATRRTSRPAVRRSRRSSITSPELDAVKALREARLHDDRPAPRSVRGGRLSKPLRGTGPGAEPARAADPGFTDDERIRAAAVESAAAAPVMLAGRSRRARSHPAEASANEPRRMQLRRMDPAHASSLGMDAPRSGTLRGAASRASARAAVGISARENRGRSGARKWDRQ